MIVPSTLATSSHVPDTFAVVIIVALFAAWVIATHWQATLKAVIAIAIVLTVLGGIIVLYSIVTLISMH
jgi:uncharacterized membrane protein